MDILYIERQKDRILEAFVRDEQPYKSVLLVEGARQVGKTALVQNALQKSSMPTYMVNLERDSLLQSEIDESKDFYEFQDLLQDRLGFEGGSRSIIFFDEAQESRKLGRYVRFMKEEWEKTTTILSGSTLRRLFRPDTRYPVGRVRRLVIWPFAFSEYLKAGGKEHLAVEILSVSPRISEKRHQTLLSLYDQYLKTGGLPAVVQAYFAAEDYHRRRAEIIADYEQDFVRIFGERSINIAKACLRSVANFVGGVSKNSTVLPTVTTQINARINEIFTRLEGWHMIIRSEQTGPSPHASHQYLPKRYLFDTGILRHLRESTVPSIDILHTLSAAARTLLGGVLENQTAVDILRFSDSVSGWKKSSVGTEIDFVVKKGEECIPVECKASLSINKRHLKGLLDYLNLFSLNRGIIVSFAPRSSITITNKTVHNIPAYMLERLEDQVQKKSR